MKPHAITPTDTRDVDTLAVPAHLRPTASSVADTSYEAWSLRMAELERGQIVTAGAHGFDDLPAFAATET